MLAVMSIGSVAHAQDAGSSSQAGAATPSATPGPTTTTTTIPPRPKPIRVTTSRYDGRVGTTVKVSADVRGCTQPSSARGEFRDFTGAVRPLLDQLVTGSSRFTGLFVVNGRDHFGSAKVRVACDVGLPTATQGYADFWVDVPGRIAVSVTPSDGGPGTVVTVRADIHGECDPGYHFFQDSKGRTSNLREPRNVSSRDHQVVGQYTITSKDAVGQGRFAVSCNMRTDYYRIGFASFWVHARGTGGSSGGSVSGGSSSGRVTANRGNGKVKVPTAIDTGLGGTANGPRRGVDPGRLLPSAWVLLVIAAVGLRAYQAIRRRSQ
jgi:hypothetical protein